MQEAAQFETADPTRLQTTDLQAGDTMRGKPLLVACAVLGTMLPEMLFAQAAATSDSAAAAAALTVTPDYASDGWVDSNQPIGLRFSRPLNLQTEHLVPNASTVQIYKATGGECVQTVGQSTQFDWQDPSWEIRVDPLQAVTTETNRSNNNKTF